MMHPARFDCNYFSSRAMVLIIDGNSEVGAHGLRLIVSGSGPQKLYDPDPDQTFQKINRHYIFSLNIIKKTILDILILF